MAIERRLFAHPDAPGAREAGGLDQVMEMEADAGVADHHEGRFARRVRLTQSALSCAAAGRLGGWWAALGSAPWDA